MIVIYDLEQFSNFHSCYAIDKDTEEEYYFEISDFKDDSVAYLRFLKECKGMIGFNNLGFDYPLLHHFIDQFAEYNTPEETSRLMYKKAQEIIDSRYGFPDWECRIPQLDLYKIWHFDNVAKITSLKDLQIAMNWENVQELPFPHSHHVAKDDRDDIESYNRNDVLSTKRFYELSRSVIDLRNDLKKIYSIPCLNWNDPKIGEQIFLNRIARKKSLHPSIIRKWRTTRDSINLGDCLVDYEVQSKALEPFIDMLENTTIEETKGSVNFRIVHKGMPYDFGTGGIHGCRESKAYKADSDSTIMTSDVASYYPNIAIKFGLAPEHLGREFIEVYSDLYERRLYAKRNGLEAENQGLKLGLNGVYGKSNDKWSFLYDPKYTMMVTINGQIMLTDLSMQLQDAGFECIMINTDGFEFIVPTDRVAEYKTICQQWMKRTGFELEHDQYKTIAIRDVNNYIGQLQSGKIKKKGAFEDKDWRNDPDFRDWHKDPSHKVVAKALEQYFIHGKNVDEYITGHEDIFDFCIRARVRGDWKLKYHYLDGYEEKTTPLQKKNRIYMSTDGGYLYKTKGERMIGVLKGQKVQIFNQFEEKEDYNIDYQWYIKETKKIIDEVEPKQMNLFI